MENQVVIVTGAASGIGLACTKLLLEGRAKVAAFDIQEDKMNNDLPKSNSNLIQISGDISDPNACKNIVTQSNKTIIKSSASIILKSSIKTSIKIS